MKSMGLRVLAKIIGAQGQAVVAQHPGVLVSHSDGEIMVLGPNIELRARDGEGEPWERMVQTQQFLRAASVLGSDDIELTPQENALLLRAKSRRVRIPLVAGSRPEIPETPEKWYPGVQEHVTAIPMPATDFYDSTYRFTWIVDGVAYATDRIRASMARIARDAEGLTTTLTLPGANTFKLFARLVRDLEVGATPHGLCMRGKLGDDTITASVSRGTGEVPGDLLRIFHGDALTWEDVAVVQAGEFIGAVKRASMIYDVPTPQPVLIEARGGTLSVSTTGNEDREFQEEIPAEAFGEHRFSISDSGLQWFFAAKEPLLLQLSQVAMRARYQESGREVILSLVK